MRHKVSRLLKQNHRSLIHFSLILIGSLVLNFLIKHVPVLSQVDTFLFYLIYNIPYPDWVATIIAPFNFNDYVGLPNTTPWFIYAGIIGLLVYIFIKERTLFWWVLGVIVLAMLAARLISVLNWFVIFRERPFLSLITSVDSVSAEVWGRFASYPSGHARDTALVATLIALYLPRLKVAAIIFSIFIAFSRVYLGAHFPFDAIAGLIIGASTAMISFEIVNEIRLQREQKEVK